MAGDTVSILEGDNFVVSDRRGDVVPSPSDPHGLFLQDTRFLSCWRLTVDGRSPDILSTDDVHYFSAQFFLVPPPDSFYTDTPYSIIRTRSVGEGFHEDITVINHRAEPLELELRIEAGADFADLFEVKDALAKRGRHYREVRDGRLVLGYGRGGFVRETWISATAPEAVLADDGIRFRITVEPQGEWTTCVEVVAAAHAFPTVPRTAKYAHGNTQARPNMGFTLEEWLEAAPELETDWRTLRLTYERSLIDLAALRFYTPILPGMALPAAGLPWFMTVFGRDSLLTSFQALPFTPELAETTLRVLAAEQGTRVDPFRDEEPGKILHEFRFGEMTAFEERPHSPYFGSADSTPLFLIVLDETERWTGNAALARELEPEARAAIEWIDQHGDRDGDGYVEYERRNPETGLENQCWKDSGNSILFADGTMSSLPRACCEIQGYVYDAKLRAARLAREIWHDPALADRLEDEADELKRRFNEDFWLADREYYALALDGEKRPVDSLTSNNGHLLWSGIVDEDRAEAVVRHLMGPRLWSGWGVRTMAEGDGGYSPVGYHNGTVWPHDNSFIAAGLARYGYRAEAGRIAYAMLEAAEFFRHRLPEVFAGYQREKTMFPVEYPTACSPQAWAAGAPLLFVSTMLGLRPDTTPTPADRVLPKGIGRLELSGNDRPRRAEPDNGRPSQASLSGSRRHAGIGGESAPGSAREFFEHIHEHFDPASAKGMRAIFRFDIEDVGSWRLVVDDGDLEISESGEEADYVVTAPEDVLMKVVRGEQHPMTAFLAGLLRVDGDLRLAPKFRKFFPTVRR
jgi:glycogen debranching enzyme/putative sterol carrier protein